MRWLIPVLCLVAVVLLFVCAKDDDVAVYKLKPNATLVAPIFMPTNGAGTLHDALADGDPTAPGPNTYASYITHPNDGYRLGFDTSPLPLAGTVTELQTVVRRLTDYPDGLISALAFVHTVHYASGSVNMGTDNMPHSLSAQTRTLTVTGLSIPVGDFSTAAVQEDFSWCCFGLASDLLIIYDMELWVTVVPASLVEEVCVGGVFALAQALTGTEFIGAPSGSFVGGHELVGNQAAPAPSATWAIDAAVGGTIEECN